MKKPLVLSALLVLLMSACVPIPILIPTISTSAASPVQALPADRAAFVAFDQALNTLRAQNERPPVAANAGLDRVARSHAADLKRRSVLLHTSANGARSSERVRAAGVSSCLAGENLAKGYDSAAGAFQGWLASPKHRRNMLDAKYANYGIGRAGKIWVLVMLLPC